MIAVNQRVAHEFNGYLRHAPGIPIFFERNNTQQQIQILRQPVSTSLPRRPDLRRNVLNEPGLPIMKPVRMGASESLDCMSQSAVKTGEIDTDDCVRLALESQIIELLKKPAKF